MHSRLVIRADADSRMGTGHIMRCIALGQAWREMSEGGNLKPEGRGERVDGGNLTSENSGLRTHPSSFSSVVFICAAISESLAERIQAEGFELIRIDAEPGSPEDIRQTLSILSGLKSPPSSFSPWLVLDGYHFDLAYHRAVRKAGYKLLLIDDYNHRPEYECDILLNQNISATDLNYRTNPEARRLLGTEYALLRREFRNVDAMPPSRFQKVGKKVLVTLGGADPDNVTLRVIEALNHLNIPDLHVKIIVGPANSHLETLRQALSLSTINCELINSGRDIPGLMQWSDLAVSAAGSTCWELCCLGVPFVTLVLADNQRGLAAELDRRKIASCLGVNPSVDEMGSKIKELVFDVKKRVCCGKAGGMLVDGFGAARVLCCPAKESGLDIFEGKLSLHPATESDMELFWEWANDPSVRANCYNKKPIPLGTHRQWFSGKLTSPDVLMLILKLDGVLAGQVRYERRGDTAGISFSIDKRFRGLGLGRKIIEQSLENAFSLLKVEQIRAEVFQANKASQSAFIKTGFELAETCAIKGVPSLVFIKKRP